MSFDMGDASCGKGLAQGCDPLVEVQELTLMQSSRFTIVLWKTLRPKPSSSTCTGTNMIGLCSDESTLLHLLGVRNRSGLSASLELFNVFDGIPGASEHDLCRYSRNEYDRTKDLSSYALFV